MPKVASLKAFKELEKRLDEALLRIEKIEARQPEWVREEEAQQLTGLSQSTLSRERRKPGTLLVWKSAGGVRYLRQSVLDFNEARIIKKNK